VPGGQEARRLEGSAPANGITYQIPRTEFELMKKLPDIPPTSLPASFPAVKPFSEPN